MVSEGGGARLQNSSKNTVLKLRCALLLMKAPKQVSPAA